VVYPTKDELRFNLNLKPVSLYVCAAHFQTFIIVSLWIIWSLAGLTMHLDC